MKRKVLLTMNELKGLLQDMKMYYMDGEYLGGRKLLKITIQKDSSGDLAHLSDGSPVRWVFSWSLYGSPRFRTCIDSKAFQYSEPELLESLQSAGIVSA